MIAVLAGLLYFGAQQVQDYLNRDKLPKPGQDAPEFASTSFLVTSSAPAPELDGTITSTPHRTRSSSSAAAQRAAGRTRGRQPRRHARVRPPGRRRLARAGRAATTTSPPSCASVPYLLGVNDADDVLEKQLRKNFIDLIDETTEGVDPDARERYEMAVDTGNYSSDYPLQWQRLRGAA